MHRLDSNRRAGRRRPKHLWGFNPCLHQRFAAAQWPPSYDRLLDCADIGTYARQLCRREVSIGVVEQHVAEVRQCRRLVLPPSRFFASGQTAEQNRIGSSVLQLYRIKLLDARPLLQRGSSQPWTITSAFLLSFQAPLAHKNDVGRARIGADAVVRLRRVRSTSFRFSA